MSPRPVVARPPVGGTFHFEILFMAPLTKTCPKMVLSHKGGSLCVKDAFAKNWQGVLTPPSIAPSPSAACSQGAPPRIQNNSGPPQKCRTQACPSTCAVDRSHPTALATKGFLRKCRTGGERAFVFLAGAAYESHAAEIRFAVSSGPTQTASSQLERAGTPARSLLSPVAHPVEEAPRSRARPPHCGPWRGRAERMRRAPVRYR